MLLLLVNFATDVRAEILIHEKFDDGDFADGSPGLWRKWDGNGTLELEDGGLIIDSIGEWRTGVRPFEVDGQRVEQGTDWSIRARLTPISADFGWAGVGTTQLNHASFNNGRFVTGNQLNTDAWNDTVSPLNNAEFIIQLDAFDDTLTGYAWRVDSPDEIMTASIDFGITPSFPVLFTHGTSAKFHEAWISSTPIPLPACDLSLDFDVDGNCNGVDIDLLGQEIIAGTNNSVFDLTGDKLVDLADQDRWRADAATENGFAEPYLNGDANLDGSVLVGDLNAVGTNWQSSPAAWSGGDFNADGIVDVADLNLLALHWQKSIPAAAAPAAVPEPTSMFMLVFAWIAIIRIDRRNRT
jgi:hypothetical protein